ncbi:MAG: T9SS type A sorting domain-containing protein [Bacteroidetes bacterium]|nr:T9SS type A sorting domain-containing protein [Bacteroidota bacterium]
MKKITFTILFFFLFSVIVFGQSYMGPDSGGVASGVVVTTDDFLSKPIGKEPPSSKRIIKLMENNTPPMYYKGNKPVSDNYVYVEDKNVRLPGGVDIGINIELQGFQAQQMRSVGGFLRIPPDNHVAVGPNNVLTAVNSEFFIWDREGNLLKNIAAEDWTGQVVANPGAFDPQIIYDHYENRWFMLWDSQDNGTQTGNFLISYSDDSDPLGTWYMYALDATLNGSTPTDTWGDYPQIGYDDQAIYIMSRQFSFSGLGLLYNKIRILNKSELYASNAGPLTWIDIWDISRPNDFNFKPDVIHPIISYDAGLNTAFFIWSNFGGADFYIVYVIEDPITNPVLSGVEIPVPTYAQAPLANQLGGGDPGIETGGSRIRNSPILRDGKIYAVHAIGNSQFPGYGSLKYFVVDINTGAVVEQVEQGAQGFFYFYPAIAVDQDHNLAITYSRSADTEYAGAYYSTKLGTDPPGLSPSKVMKEGEDNYVVTFGGSRNRWGDYLSAALDPVNEYNIWLFSEYASDDGVTGNGTWSTWLTEIRMKPFSGVYAFTPSPSMEFGNIEVNISSNTITAILANFGDQDLVINNIPSSMGDFNLDISGLSFPITIASFDTLLLDFTFNPTVPDSVQETFLVNSNDPNFIGFTLTGNGFVINPALDRVMYASSGSQNEGNILSVVKETGEGTNIGPSFFNDILGITISPLDKKLYAVRSTPSESEILRINSLGGDAYSLYSLDLGNMVAISFDTSGILYGALETGEIYSIDLTNGTYDSISTAPIEITAITFEPMTNDLWATVKGGFGSPKDKIYKIDLATGDTTFVGQTGFNTSTNDLAFDENGVLYGIKGTGPQVSDLFTINVNTGEGTIIGPVGLKALTGLAYAETGVTSVEGRDDKSIPTEFILSQNYPNPFNPSTSIEFSVPVNSNVRLTIYNLLGQEVTTLVNEELSAGNYSVIWNGTDKNGLQVSSGVYLYKMKANGNNGTPYSQTKKMILLK